MSDALKVLAAPRRREMLRLVWSRERSAGEIHRELGDVTFGAVSQHLRALAGASLVRVRREGTFRFYRADRARAAPFRAWLEASWDDALYRLRLAAELEEGRRGPRSRTRRRNSL
jgi:DNA-binding transcriptional ArsR family regulator